MQLLRVLVILAVVGLLGRGVLAPLWAAQAKPSEVSLETWSPELDQPIRQLEHRLATLEQPQPQNETAANLGFLYDAKLYIAFHRLAASLEPDAKARLIAEQRDWLDERRRIALEAADEHTGGSLAGLIGTQAFIDATRDRLAALQRRP
jgi:uncharacterized protein YecT (DUF1311 family)